MTKNVNLRKASSIQKEIQNYLTDLKLSTDIKVPVDLKEAKATIAAAQARLTSTLTTQLKLNTILMTIRDLVSNANTVSGVSSLLAKENLYKNQIKVLEKVKAGTAVLTDTVLRTKIEKAMSNESTGYGSSSYEVSTGIVSDDIYTDVMAQIVDLKRQKNKANESILALNVKTEISISDEDYQFLQLLGIV